MVRGHLGSTLGIAFGALLAFSAFAPSGANAPPNPKVDTLIAGLAIIVGANAYRSCKKRKLGEVPNSYLRLGIELLGIVLIVLSVLMRNNLRNQLILEPVTNAIIPFVVLLAYAIVSFRKSPTAPLEKL